ncbi:Fe3+-citrate ABC transporter substrate-binding protein [Streptomyces sp. AJS327]|nr:Fe3+-citrate ABC transporter substrate-binding protein [Streptomyces sp. AJS327]
MLRGLAAGSAAALGGTALAACSSREDRDAASTGGKGGGFTVTDQRGEKLRFDQPVQRIVTTVMPVPAILTAVDGGYGRIKGINESTRTANREGLFGVMHPASKNTTTVAGSDFAPNVETVVKLEPDVVIQWADQGDDVIAPLEKAGCVVLGLTYGTQKHLETWVSTFGKLTGERGRAKAILDWMEEEATAVKAAVRKLRAREPKVLYLNAATDGYETYGDHYMDHSVALAGGTSAATGLPPGNTAVGTEQLHRWDPDVILLGAFDASTPADIYRAPALRSLRAVRQRRVYKIPLGGYRWDPPNCESPLMWRWLSQVLHPGLRADVRERLPERLGYLYDYEISPKQADEILRIDMNGKSAGYGRFRG